MCGIAGIVAKNSKVYREELRAMTETLVHRGPDGEGSYFFPTCALGHRRLSIVDLTSTGHQPMFSKDKKTAVVFNGEIYGYQEIKQSLLEYRFVTNSDTEVILALYERYKDEFLNYLPGMFAFALWDEKRKTLICARDRFGEKPFYYAFGKKGEFLFASEIKALLASNLIMPELDNEFLGYYLKHLYIEPRRTVYKNIFILPPAHALYFANGKAEVKRYWLMPEINNEIEVPDAILEFRRLLDQAVKRQLVADVPVGAFLSGGLDSSTIVALASRHKINLNTFSFGFRDSINELPFAQEIASKYKTHHQELLDDKEDLGELLQKMQLIYDEPFADSSNIPTYLLSKLARQYTKVALNGDGGDELLGGYGWYRPFFYYQKPKKENLNSVDFLFFIARVMRRLSPVSKSKLFDRLLGEKMAADFVSPVQAHLVHQNAVFSDEELSVLGLNDKFSGNYEPSWPAGDSLDDVMRSDIENYFPGDLLVKTDRASMASGLELRTPFLDKDFAGFCLSLPFRLKINQDVDKLILRKAFGDLWTDSIRRRSKQGFGAPISKWLKEKSLRQLKNDFLKKPSRKIFTLIPFEKAQLFIKNNNYKSWSLLVLSLWLENRSFK